MTGGAEELFDAKFLGRLRALFFRLRKRRQLKKKGEQQTASAGFTREFKDHRHYTPGDDFRSVDWRIYARLEKMFVRIYEEIQEFHVHVIVDRSASMLEPYSRKRIAALKLATALSYLGLVSQHRVSVMTMSDMTRRETHPMKGQGHIHEILERLAALEFSGLTDLETSLKSFKPGRDRRGIVFVISDLLGREIGSATSALRHALKWPAETHVIHIVEPEEAAPEFDGDVELVDVETGGSRRMWLTKREMARYKKAFADFSDEVGQTCAGYQIDYLTWSTAESFEDAFLRLLTRGSALAQT